MKRIFLCALVGVSSLALNAQTWNVGLGAGYQHNELKAKNNKEGGRDGYKVEAVFDYTLPSNVVFSSGLGFSKKGGRLTGERLGGVDNLRQVDVKSMHYLTLPLLVGYQFKLGSIELLPQVGGYAAMGLGGKAYAYSRDAQGKETVVKMNNVFKASNSVPFQPFKRFDYGLSFALSLTVKHLRMKVFYEHSLHKINPSLGNPHHSNLGASFIVMLK